MRKKSKMKSLILIGASGQGKVVADIARRLGYDSISFLDDNENVKECANYPVIGKSSEFVNYDCDFFISIGNARVRKMLQEKLISNGKNVLTLIHPNAVISENVTIGTGTVVMAGAVVNSGAKIGDGCIINTCSSVDHDCNVGDYAHVSVGAHLAGTVNIGECTWVGIGATVSNNINITANCMIGAGAVVVKDITKEGTYIGVPARLI